MSHDRVAEQSSLAKKLKEENQLLWQVIKQMNSSTRILEIVVDERDKTIAELQALVEKQQKELTCHENRQRNEEKEQCCRVMHVPVIINELRPDEASLQVWRNMPKVFGGRAHFEVLGDLGQGRLPLCVYSVMCTTDRLGEQISHEKLAKVISNADKVIVVALRKGCIENSMIKLSNSVGVYSVRTIYWYSDEAVRNDWTNKELNGLFADLQQS
eukprot:TRINITY_DN171_c0_g1_i1.p1 TRINITY_DN171_c0_g1~~TRINITY_DN171_c0_g1_i1.p1  ORF type:complete len:214 (+),score=35.84 TRINITY_DN171_c0_g1_i1:151-792(+)